jgi:hypothetical protein
MSNNGVGLGVRGELNLSPIELPAIIHGEAWSRIPAFSVQCTSGPGRQGWAAAQGTAASRSLSIYR